MSCYFKLNSKIKLILFCENISPLCHLYIISNRIRNLLVSIRTEFGAESVTILRTWEKLEKKIANFKTHRRFTLRGISQKITPSLKLRSNIKPPEGRGSYTGQRNNWQMNG